MDIWFYVLAAPVVILLGMSKGGFGGGLGMLAVPVLSLVIDPRLAAAILLPILCTMDAFSLWSFRRYWREVWRGQNLHWLLPGALVGIVVGALTFQITNADWIRLLVGLLSLYFVAHYLWTRQFLSSVAQHGPNARAASFWGGVAGYTSYIAHAGGPPVSIYLLPQRLPKSLFAASTVIFFALVNFVKLFPYGYFGQLNFSSLHISLLLLPLAPLGVWLGFYLHSRVSDKFFYWVSYVALLLAGIKLTYEGLRGLMH